MTKVALVKPKDLPNPSGRIDELIAKITDWRSATFARVRKIIRATDPEIPEEFKYMGIPVWSRDGTIAVANAFKGRVNVTFANGASLPEVTRREPLSRDFRPAGVLRRGSLG